MEKAKMDRAKQELPVVPYKPVTKKPTEIHKHKPTVTDSSNEPSTVSNVFKPPEKQTGRDGPINSISGQTRGSGEIKVESARGRRKKQPHDNNPKPPKRVRPAVDDSDSGINTDNEDSNHPPLREPPIQESSNENNIDIADQFQNEVATPEDNNIDTNQNVSMTAAASMNQALGHRGMFAGQTIRNNAYEK
ncbi:hypothetical protein BpHYR1_000450 [Brachionus plicatilis]|uniref:Uncharacterized protein n=1 Tax=Brachionus plicatilis TaxID=10195 RepID=A0A3M7RMI9_BRAPC|nr:hypothetical protein BpHYR1_000450 [Brachionus plicatilis]